MSCFVIARVTEYLWKKKRQKKKTKRISPGMFRNFGKIGTIWKFQFDITMDVKFVPRVSSRLTSTLAASQWSDPTPSSWSKKMKQLARALTGQFNFKKFDLVAKMSLEKESETHFKGSVPKERKSGKHGRRYPWLWSWFLRVFGWGEGEENDEGNLSQELDGFIANERGDVINIFLDPHCCRIMQPRFSHS